MIEQNNDGGVQGPEHRVVGRRGVEGDEVVYVDRWCNYCTGVGGGGGDAVALRTRCPRGPCPRCTKACRVAGI